MTKEEAQQFRAGWKLVNDFVIEEARQTSPSDKLHQLALMYEAGQMLGWNQEPRINEKDAVRERWRLLREKLQA